MNKVLLSAILFTAFAASNAVQIANSITDYSLVQGTNSWFYGYYDKSNDATPGSYSSSEFTLMNQVSGGTWWVNNVDSTVTGYFTRLYQVGGHSNGLDNYPGRTRALAEHFAIRRWQSTVTGSLTFAVTIAKIDTAGGNGTNFFLYKNGTVILSPFQPFTTSTPSTFSVTTFVTAGDYIDLSLDSWQAQDANDNTALSMTVEAVPEPATMTGLGLALIALVRKKGPKRNLS